MAYGLAIAKAYVELMLARGHGRGRVRAAHLVQLHVRGARSSRRSAKFRAGRRLYARMLREHFGATNPKSWMFRSLIGGGGSAFTVQEPENNIVRGAYIALAAALSGAQTMALPTYDEAYTIPSREGAAHRAAHDADLRGGVRAPPTPPTRSAARTTSRRSPTRWSG